MDLKIAFATDDGKNFIKRHFGDAERFDIYEMNEKGRKFLKSLHNTVEDSEDHADENKAKGISGLLKEEKVQIAVSKIFGPNIKRIKSKFVCVIVNDKNEISVSLDILEKNFGQLVNEWNKGEERTYLKL